MADRPLNGMAAGFCGQLKNFVTCLHSNTAQLKASISQKPPAYGDLSSFLLDFNDRAAEDGAQMDSLEEMIVDNVSFDELVAHCTELYKQNEAGIATLESQLEQFGYAKAVDKTSVEEEKQGLEASFVEDLKQRVRAKESSPRGSTESREDIVAVQNVNELYSSNSSGRSYAHFETIRSSGSRGISQPHLTAFQSPLPSAVANSKMDSADLSMLGESFSLEDFGLSASSLAALPRIDPMSSGTAASPAEEQREVTPVKNPSEVDSEDMDESCGSSPVSSPSFKSNQQPVVGDKSPSTLLDLVTEDEYSQVLPWLRLRVPLEELNETIVKINDAFHTEQSKMLGGGKIDGKPLQLEESFLHGLGSNMKACLLILVQIDRLVMACHNGRASYRPSEVLVSYSVKLAFCELDDKLVITMEECLVPLGCVESFILPAALLQLKV